MSVDIGELEGAALDRAVSEAVIDFAPDWVKRQALSGEAKPYSSSWMWGGPLIEYEHMEVEYLGDTENSKRTGNNWKVFCGEESGKGHTLLVAAMRAFVASRSKTK